MTDDFTPHWRTSQLRPADLEAFQKDAPAQRVDGLTPDDQVRIRLPVFQRSLVWGKPKRQQFYRALKEGWPFGIVTLAAGGTEEVDGETVRIFRVIDGLQRLSSIWAFRSRFFEWYEPSPNDAEKVQRITQLSSLGEPCTNAKELLTLWLHRVSAGDDQLTDSNLLFAVERETTGTFVFGNADHQEATRIAQQIVLKIQRERDELERTIVPVQIIQPELDNQLPVIFEKLNSGLRLSKYDILAATLDSVDVVLDDQSAITEDDRQQLIAHANGRFAGAVEEGYEVEEYQSDTTEVSLFDYLFGLSRFAETERSSFRTVAGTELGFQVAALVFSQSLRALNEGSAHHLFRTFPRENETDRADIAVFDRAFREGVAAVDETLTQYVGWGLQKANLVNPLGLVQAATYVSAYIALVYRLDVDGLRERSSSADLESSLGLLTVQQRRTRFRDTLRWWLLLDSLSRTFVGSDAYENAAKRVWEPREDDDEERLPTVAETMLRRPDLNALRQPLRELFLSSLEISATPRKRVALSAPGATLMRIAFAAHSGAMASGTVDHIYPMKWHQAAISEERIEPGAYALNHFANLAFISESDNKQRRDRLFPVWLDTKTEPELTALIDRVRPALLMEPDSLGAACCADPTSFRTFLSERAEKVILQALHALLGPGPTDNDSERAAEVAKEATNLE